MATVGRVPVVPAVPVLPMTSIQNMVGFDQAKISPVCPLLYLHWFTINKDRFKEKFAWANFLTLSFYKASGHKIFPTHIWKAKLWPIKYCDIKVNVQQNWDDFISQGLLES